MKILTFICVLVVSVSVYAKTEARLIEKGFSEKEPKQQRNVAADTVTDMSAVMAQLNKMNGAPKAKSVTADSIGFSGNSGALTKPQKKSAVFTTAELNKTK